MEDAFIFQYFLQDYFCLSEEEQRRRQEEEQRRRKEELRSQLKQSSNQELLSKQKSITWSLVFRNPFSSHHDEEMELSLIKEEISRRKDKIRSQLWKLSDLKLLLRETSTTEQMELSLIKEEISRRKDEFRSQLKKLSDQELLMKQTSISEEMAWSLIQEMAWSLIQEEISRRKKEKLRSQLRKISYDELLYKQTKFRRWPFRHFRLLDDEEMELSLIEEEIRRRKDEIRIQLKKLSYNELLRRQTDINESRRTNAWYSLLHRYEEMELSLIKEEIIRRTIRRQQFRPKIPTTVSFTTGRILLRVAIVIAGFQTPSCAASTVECPTEQYIRLRGRAVVKCNGLENLPSIYWYNNTNEDATAFIQKVKGEVTGAGYRAGDYYIDNEGSLVIYKVEVRDDRTFRVRTLNSGLIGSSDNVKTIVYAEPSEPLPVIPECSGKSACILKWDLDRTLSCIHGESRPAMEVSWFLRVGREDILLNTTENQIMSADSVTVTTSAQLTVEQIAVHAKLNQLLALVCKSSQPIPGSKGSELVSLLDISVHDPFTNEEHPNQLYAIERQEQFMIPCQSKIDTENEVVLWMYKSLNSENVEYILYSAYGEVAFATQVDAGFNLTDNGALVIKQVDLQHEGYYACVISSENTTVSFVQNLEVIVLPNPPRIVVQGCEPFQPCHLSAQEADTITCTVNGVRPQVDLSIVTYSMNVAVTNTAVNSHKEGGLFYTTVEGHVDVSKVSCEENHLTVICQARGTAAHGFMSDAYIMVTVDGDDCANTSIVTVKPDDAVGRSNIWMVFINISISILLVIVVVYYIFANRIVCRICRSRRERYSLPLNGALRNESDDVIRM